MLPEGSVISRDIPCIHSFSINHLGPGPIQATRKKQGNKPGTKLFQGMLMHHLLTHAHL